MRLISLLVVLLLAVVLVLSGVASCQVDTGEVQSRRDSGWDIP